MGYGGPPPPMGAPGYPPQGPPPPPYAPGGGAGYAMMPGSAPKPRLQVRKRLLFPAILLLVVGALALSSLGLGWYYLDVSSSQQTVSAYFTVSQECGTTTTSSGTSTSCVSYPVPAVQSLYGVVEALAAAGGIMGLVAGLFALLGSVGKTLFRRQGHLGFLLGIFGGVLVLAAPVALLVAQPAALASGSGASSGVCGTSGPQATFFGSCTGTTSAGGTAVPVTVTYGPDVAWYLCLVAFVIALVGATRLRDAAKHHEDEDLMNSALTPAPFLASPPQMFPSSPYAGQSAWPPSGTVPGGGGGYPPAGAPPYSAPAPPPVAPTYAATPPPPGYGGPGRGIVCRNCGTVNPQGAYTCGRCDQRLF